MYFAHSKGIFAGFSLEGAVLLSRFTTNKAFYGASAKIGDILNGTIQVPPNKVVFVERFHQTLCNFQDGKTVGTIEIGSDRSVPSSKREDSSDNTPKKLDQNTRTPATDEEPLLDFRGLGLEGKHILRDSLTTLSLPVTVAFTADHIVDESHPSEFNGIRNLNRN